MKPLAPREYRTTAEVLRAKVAGKNKPQLQLKPTPAMAARTRLAMSLGLDASRRNKSSISLPRLTFLDGGES
jgi:hypothetical protein